MHVAIETAINVATVTSTTVINYNCQTICFVIYMSILNIVPVLVHLQDCHYVSSTVLHAKFLYFVEHKYFHQFRATLYNESCMLGIHFPNGDVGFREARSFADQIISLLKKCKCSIFCSTL